MYDIRDIYVQNTMFRGGGWPMWKKIKKQEKPKKIT